VYGQTVGPARIIQRSLFYATTITCHFLPYMWKQSLK
jgi:hypothetical protein